jgi:ribosomal RNA-processing protein 12
LKQILGLVTDFEEDEDEDLDEAKPGRYVLAQREQREDLSTGMQELSLYKPGGRGIHRPLSNGVHSGAEYKSAKAQGDIKKKGKLDPYAYVPLSGALLNKR